MLSYMKVEIIATVEWCEKNIPEKLYDQKRAKSFGNENFQRWQYEL